MAYEPTVLRRAAARLRAQKERRERERYALRQRLCQAYPELPRLDAALRGTMAEVAELVLSGGADAEGKLEEIKTRNQQLQRGRTGPATVPTPWTMRPPAPGAGTPAG